MECWGERVSGEPTVLLITGQGPTTSSWELVASAFAADGHHLCSYDRAGVGGSDPAPEASRTTEDQVTDLVALLDAAALQEPVVLVAHSLGSHPAVGLVARAPERVAGVVLIDPLPPRVGAAQRAALPPEKPDESPEAAEERRFLTEVLFDPAQNPEHLLLAASDEEVATLLDEPGPIFGDLPTVVLQGPGPPRVPGLPDSYHAATVAAFSDGFRELAAESTRGTLVEVDDTGHNIQDDQPEVVMDAIRDVMAG
jgi:pimeloyl-ACP methyl ester carboxylesterase